MFGVERQTYLGWCQNNAKRISYFPVETYDDSVFTGSVEYSSNGGPDLFVVFDAPDSITRSFREPLSELLLDWKHPRKSELQMVELSTGFNLEKPLKMLRDLVDKK